MEKYFGLCAKVRFNRPVTDDDIIWPGQYEMIMGGEKLSFDFCDEDHTPLSEDGAVCEICVSNPDISNFPDFNKMTPERLSSITGIPEFFIFTGEEGETDLKPVELISAYIYDGPTEYVIPSEVCKAAQMCCNITQDPLDAFRLYTVIRLAKPIKRSQLLFTTGCHKFTFDGNAERAIGFMVTEAELSEDGMQITIEEKEPAFEYFEEMLPVTKAMLQKVTSFNVYAIDPDEDDPFEPVEVVNAAFVLPYEGFEQIDISEDAFKGCKFSDADKPKARYYGVRRNRKGLSELRYVYKPDEMEAFERENGGTFDPDGYESGFCGNDTYDVTPLHTVKDVRNFLVGPMEQDLDDPTLLDLAEWYWEVQRECLFTGNENKTTSDLIRLLKLTDEELSGEDPRYHEFDEVADLDFYSAENRDMRYSEAVKKFGI